jgi:outer membrane protein OmpA-like peptidoglycan-associated protein
MTVGDQLTNANWMGKTLPSQLKIGRSICKSFNLGAEFSYLTIEPGKLSALPTVTPVESDNMYRIGGQVEYKFANGYLLKETAMFDPYIFLGLNGSNVDEKTFFTQSTGVGLNIWVTDWLGVNGEGSYEYLFDWNDYFHYSFGLVARFGKSADMDKDGISDKKDLCPEIPGIVELQGCPDSDGDGITDKDDKCPKVAGPKATFGCPDKDGDGVVDDVDKCPTVPGLSSLNGCPDKDGDGIADNDDQCPDVKGTVATKGCPDADGDGIPDKDDLCPNDKGPAATKGCPDRDGDGVLDKDDKCPDIKGPKENAGCPLQEAAVVPAEQPASMEFKDVYFDTNKSSVKSTSSKDLENALNIMKSNPQSRFSIYGYTDNTGPADFNLRLSKERANSVKKYFTDKGITGNRLDAEGFGINNPKATNDTPEGRDLNRRVEIKMLK